MKAEHRHELKTNELADWLGNLPQWTKENLKMIIYVTVVVVVVAGAYIYKKYEKDVVAVEKQTNFTNALVQLPGAKMQNLRSQSQGIDTSYTFIQIADNLESFAQKEKNDNMAALALIKQAEALRMELHYRLEAGSRQEIKTQIEKTKAIYTKALDRTADNSSLAAAAKFGLGLCEEELGNFDSAKEIYDGIAKNDKFQSTIAAAQAKQRIETLDDYKQKVRFKKALRPMPDMLQFGIKPDMSKVPMPVDLETKIPELTETPAHQIEQ
ncbi:MAG: hypothetical protein KAI59_02595 [Planctomycetes bacterium]|nr:hypothetical protein [Planctomycetota bacterium]